MSHGAGGVSSVRFGIIPRCLPTTLIEEYLNQARAAQGFAYPILQLGLGQGHDAITPRGWPRPAVAVESEAFRYLSISVYGERVWGSRVPLDHRGGW